MQKAYIFAMALIGHKILYATWEGFQILVVAPFFLVI